MKLIFAYIQHFKNLRGLEIPLSDDYNVSFTRGQLLIQKTGIEEVKNTLYGGNLIKDLHIIVGRTGSGKTNLLQLIGMEEKDRKLSSRSDAYFLLYKCSIGEDKFA